MLLNDLFHSSHTHPQVVCVEYPDTEPTSTSYHFISIGSIHSPQYHQLMPIRCRLQYFKAELHKLTINHAINH